MTITADQMAMTVSNDTERNAWVERYEREIQGIKVNTLDRQYDELGEMINSGKDRSTIEWKTKQIKYTIRQIEHKQKMINKLRAMLF